MTTSSRIPTFTTSTALIRWLHAQGLDTVTWGQDDAKTVDDLWYELQNGECTLQRVPLLRIVHVVEVEVIQDDKVLIESEQHFADGRTRTRNRLPSEKMKPDEDPLDAAHRCLVEELARPATDITVPPQPRVTRTMRTESGSYPNLTSQYTFYTLHAYVANLPTTTFTTPNAAHAAGDPIVAHRWEWVPK